MAVLGYAVEEVEPPGKSLHPWGHIFKGAHGIQVSELFCFLVHDVTKGSPGRN